MPLPTLDSLDPDQVRRLNRELAQFVSTIPKMRPPLRMMGGFFGRMSANLRKEAEQAIFLSRVSRDESVRRLADDMEQALIPTLSFMERSAYHTRQAIKVELQKRTESEQKLYNLEEAIAATKQKSISATAEEKILLDVVVKEQERQRSQILSGMTISDRQHSKYKQLLREFEDAFSDSQREMIQARLDGMISGEEKVLKIVQDRLSSEEAEYTKQSEMLMGLSEEERPIKERELKNKKQTIKLMREEAKLLKAGIAARKKGMQETTKEYKKGLKGFVGEVIGKSFKTGLFGALKGEGFGDLFGVALNTMIDRSGILSKTLPKMLGGAKLANFFYGGESEEARKQQQFATDEISAMREGAAGIQRIVEAESTGELPPVPVEGEEGEETPSVEDLLDELSDGMAEGIDDSELSRSATEPGSIYTHDIHLEKILADIGKALTKDWGGVGSKEEKALAAPSTTPEKGGMGSKLGGAAKGGIVGLLSGIASGVKKFASKDVLKGALGMLSVGAALAPFVIALVALAAVPIAGLLAAIGALGMVALGAIVFGKFESSILKGALAIAAIGAALIPAAFAFSMLGSIDTATIWNAVGALAALSAVAIGLGAIAMSGFGAAALGAGAVMLALIGAAFIPFAYGLSLLSKVDPALLNELGPALLGLMPAIGLLALFAPLLPIAALGLISLSGGLFALGLAMMIYDAKVLEAFSAFIQVFAMTAPMLALAGVAMFLIAGGLLAMGAAIGTVNTILAAGQAIGGIAKWLGFDPGPGIMGVINTLANQAPALMTTANALSAIADALERIGSAMNSFANGEMAMQTVDALVSLDATQLQTLQDVSLAMEKVSNANDQLKSQRTEAQMMAASTEGGSATIVNNSSVGTNNVMFPPSGGRNPDPSIMFSRERYYSMIYR